MRAATKELGGEPAHDGVKQYLADDEERHRDREPDVHAECCKSGSGAAPGHSHPRQPRRPRGVPDLSVPVPAPAAWRPIVVNATVAVTRRHARRRHILSIDACHGEERSTRWCSPPRKRSRGSTIAAEPPASGRCRHHNGKR